MGTRLYPRTKDVAIIEKLASVPAGTNARLDANLSEAFYSVAKGYDEERMYYKQRMEDPHMGILYDFKLWGWGRFDLEAYSLLESNDLDPDNDFLEAEDELCETLLQIMGVKLPEGISVKELGGLTWC